MDWPHDPDGEKGSEEGRKYGHAVLVKLVDEEESFPLSFEDLAAEYSDYPVRIDHETVVSAGDIFDHVEVETAEDITAYHTAIGDAMRKAGYWPVAPESPDEYSA
jgi:hypothetical protein